MSDLVYVLRCDGRRDYIGQAIASAEDHVKGDFVRKFIVNDSGDQDYAAWLETCFPTFEFVHHPERQGMNACVKSAFEVVVASGAFACFSTEDDFTFFKPVSARKMARVLHCEPHLGQLVLKRNPWSDEEIVAGGQMEVSPDQYVEKSCLSGHWVERQGGLWSGNPSLTRTAAIEAALAKWDTVTSSDTYEQPVGNAMIEAGYSVAFWGKRDDNPRCDHLGHARSSGYQW